MKLEAKHFIVTGGASGLGAAAVECLTAKGAKVTILDSNNLELKLYLFSIFHLKFQRKFSPENKSQSAVCFLVSFSFVCSCENKIFLFYKNRKFSVS